MTKYNIYVGNVSDSTDFGSNALCHYQSTTDKERHSFQCDPPLLGQYVIVQKRATGDVVLCEVEVYTAPGECCTSVHVCGGWPIVDKWGLSIVDNVLACLLNSVLHLQGDISRVATRALFDEHAFQNRL